jgi:hypothetical protein
MIEPPPIPDQQEQVLVMDDLTDSSNELHPLIDDLENEVDLPPFPNLQNMAPLVVEEVQIEDLIPFENLGPNPNQNNNFGPADIKIGMVHTFFNNPDPSQFLSLNTPEQFLHPVWEQPKSANVNLIQSYLDKQKQSSPHFSLGPVMHDKSLWSSTQQYHSGPSLRQDKSNLSSSPKAIRLWAKFFRGIDQSQPNVLMPTQWMNFFTLLLLKQSSFDWAKDLLQSPAWQLISGDANNEGYYFSLPASKPSISNSEIVCSECDTHDDTSNNLTMLTGLQDSATLEVTLQLNGSSTDQSSYQSPPSVQDPSAIPLRDNKGKQLHISEDGLRRSNRIHNLSKGFKSSSQKKEKMLSWL